MKKRFGLWAIALLAVTLAATILIYGQLPARIPSHWNAAGQADSYGPRAGVFLEPVVML